MAERKELEITITPEGEVQVRVKCIKGQSCVDETRFLEEALGDTIESRELTDEYYEQPAGVTNSQKTR